jgi:hypothetical protein
MQDWHVVHLPKADWIDNDEVIDHAENYALYLRVVSGVDAIVLPDPKAPARASTTSSVPITTAQAGRA